METDLKNKPYFVLTVVGGGTLLSAMAGSMINLALPDLGRDLGISIEDSRLVVQSFLLVVGAFLLVAGRLGDLIGHRQVYLLGFFVFGTASLFCGLVESYTWLIAFRVLQGVGGAMVMASGPALLTLSFPVKQRGRALGMLATATYVGLTVGPTLGGLIVSALGWRWTFFVYVPTSLTVIGLGFWLLPRKKTIRDQTRFDWSGTFSLLVGLPFLLLALTEFQHWGVLSWQSWLLAAIGGSGLAAFVIIQRRSTSPLLDLDLFHSRIFSGAAVSAVANYTALSAVMILIPFYLEEGLGKQPSEAGMFLSVQPVLMAISASPSGWLSDRIGSRILAVLGMVIMAVGLFGLSELGPDCCNAGVILWLGLIGLGTGIFISPNSNALMGAAPRNQQGAAGAVLAESRVLGMFLGVAIATTIYETLGGRTGKIWRPQDFFAMDVAFKVAAVIACLGAVASGLRGAKKD
ncbi:MAG TPA: MFS transporter [Myxococcota bacterium]|nr:MFS transporter [Myxococcota bacterium]